MNLVNTSYPKDWVTILMQDVKGKVPILSTEEREKLNQGGTHYSEMLPLEYKPTEKYHEIYEKSLKELSFETATAVALLSDKIIQRKGKDVVIVSFARAGTPIGILVKHYIKFKYGYNVPHYSISIIRGKGIDYKAMDIISANHPVKDILFLDGWVGKGAINHVLEESCEELKNRDPKYNDIDPTLAVLSDPAGVTDLYGTKQDFLIPSACLNATVSGLISRSVKLKTMTDEELHGAVYYKEHEADDKSIEFINTVEGYFPEIKGDCFVPSKEEADPNFKGIDEVLEIGKKYGVEDVNKIKPGVGETTRVLLRRVPYKVLVREDANPKYMKHILQLCEEKNIPVEKYPFKKYNVCGIIKTVADL